jgi:hypothetical protein
MSGKVEITLEDLQSLCKRQKEITITFTKKDGSERVLRGTRELEFIPEEFHPKEKAPVDGDKPTKPAVNLSIFDLDAQGWRSIVPSSVKKVEFTLE